MDRKLCPLHDTSLPFCYCDGEMCAWFDAESQGCAIAALPEALDVLVRFCLTTGYPPLPDEDGV